MPNIIRPSYFTNSRTLGEWDPATLQRLVPFLVGKQIIAVTETRTGHAVQGEVIRYQESTVNSYYPHLAIRDQHGQTTLYRVSNLGEIMTLDPMCKVRWDAEAAIREEKYAALAAVRAFMGGIDFPTEEPYKGRRQWTMTLTSRGVTVAWGESFRDRRWYVDHEGNVTVPR